MVMNAVKKRWLLGFSLMWALSNVQAQGVEVTQQPVVVDDVVLTHDRFEAFNRGAFQFNDGWDQVLFKPIAKGYQKVVPANLRGCVHGFFENLRVPYTALNNILQGKLKSAGQDMCRFVVNTTVGVGGCIDMASKWHIPKHEEDFGQTLGKWGVPAGPFVMLPALGPSTLRDALAKPIDFIADPIGYVQAIKVRNSLRGLDVVDKRTSLLETLEFVDDVAIDRYSMTRDAWLQKREADVRDEDYAPDEVPLSSIGAGVVPQVESNTPAAIGGSTSAVEKKPIEAEARTSNISSANDSLLEAERLAKQMHEPVGGVKK